jgi:hypothetical protein
MCQDEYDVQLTLLREGKLLLVEEHTLSTASLILSPESFEEAVRTRLPAEPSSAACTPPASVTVISLQVSSFRLSRAGSSAGPSLAGRFTKTGDPTGLGRF